jgi:hypothetical protein
MSIKLKFGGAEVTVPAGANVTLRSVVALAADLLVRCGVPSPTAALIRILPLVFGTGFLSLIGVLLRWRGAARRRRALVVPADALVEEVDHLKFRHNECKKKEWKRMPLVAFRRWVLAEFKAKRGTPERTLANEMLTRREMRTIILEHRPKIRGTDLNDMVTVLTQLAFVPTEEEVELSQLFSVEDSWTEWVLKKFGITTRVHQRLNSLVRASK